MSPEIYEPKDHNDELTNVSKSMSSVRYAEAYPGVELRYDLIGTELKESYVIADRESAAEELTTLVYAPGLTPVLHEDGSIEFVTEAQEPVFFVPAPYMYDDGIETGSVKTRLYLMSSGEVFCKQLFKCIMDNVFCRILVRSKMIGLIKHQWTIFLVKPSIKRMGVADFII